MVSGHLILVTDDNQNDRMVSGHLILVTDDNRMVSGHLILVTDDNQNVSQGQNLQQFSFLTFGKNSQHQLSLTVIGSQKCPRVSEILNLASLLPIIVSKHFAPSSTFYRL